MRSRQRNKPIFLMLALAWLLAACGGSAGSAGEATAAAGDLSTAVLETVDDTPNTPTLAPPPTETVAPPIVVTEPEVEAEATPTVPPLPEPMTPTPVPGGPSTATGYRVAYVAPDDVLNVRAEAGVESEIVAELASDAEGLVFTGADEEVDGALWAEIWVGDETGWVNTQFLTFNQPADEFCDNPAVLAVLEQFNEAVTNQDDDALAALIDPDRGLRVNRNWWNPTVTLYGADAAAPFSSDTSFDWGIADGSGEPIVGTFSNVALPLLEDDLLPATEMGCNEILNGGTAGMIRLPDGYESINYYSVYRPAGPDQIEFDWGTWVVGIEYWDGAYRLAYLVHFQWEI